MSQDDWSIYREGTGEFTGVVISVPESALDSHTPPGCNRVRGRFDPRRYRVDIATGDVVEVEVVPLDESATIRSQFARAEIARIEAAQHRAIREVALGMEGAKERLKAMDDQIQKLRADL